jgi:hypothetical protein
MIQASSPYCKNLSAKTETHARGQKVEKKKKKVGTGAGFTTLSYFFMFPEPKLLLCLQKFA